MARACCVCGKRSYSDYCVQHKPRKPIATKQHCVGCDAIGHSKKDCPNRLDPAVKTKDGRYPPLKKFQYGSGQFNMKWVKTRSIWIKQNPPTHQGYYTCHYCGVSITTLDMTLDHKIPRSRAPELRYDFDNLVPACFICNGLKGSVAHDDYRHECHT